MLKFLLVVMVVVLISCNSEKGLSGVYSRTIKTSDGGVASNKRQELLFYSDSLYKLINFHVEMLSRTDLDSTISKGKFFISGSNIYLTPENLKEPQFCLYRRGKNIFFYDCTQGKNAKLARLKLSNFK